ncbi:hypothetical protein, partial [Bacillus cereus]|uniref:hypothetical protein n=1 Tax=Bacillus cereus TaxID=1396 RepID=UPI0034D6A17C
EFTVDVRLSACSRAPTEVVTTAEIELAQLSDDSITLLTTFMMLLKLVIAESAASVLLELLLTTLDNEVVKLSELSTTSTVNEVLFE